MIFEIAVDSANSAQKAKQAGATRIELCAALSEGGVTPSFSLMEYCINELKINTQVLIRPRAGDFLYNEIEFALICKEVQRCKSICAQGVVVGFLHKDGAVDREKLLQVVQLAEGMDVTFHRAFDVCNHWEAALETIIECGCSRILTSGLHNTAYEGKKVLKQIIEKANNRIEILVGSGVNSNNWKEIAEETGCTQMHLSAKETVPSQMSYRNPTVSMGKSGADEYVVFEASYAMIQNILNQ